MKNRFCTCIKNWYYEYHTGKGQFPSTFLKKKPPCFMRNPWQDTGKAKAAASLAFSAAFSSADMIMWQSLDSASRHVRGCQSQGTLLLSQQETVRRICGMIMPVASGPYVPPASCRSVRPQLRNPPSRSRERCPEQQNPVQTCGAGRTDKVQEPV